MTMTGSMEAGGVILGVGKSPNSWLDLRSYLLENVSVSGASAIRRVAGGLFEQRFGIEWPHSSVTHVCDFPQMPRAFYSHGR